METSAKNATNVEQAFMAMAAEIKSRYYLSLLCQVRVGLGSFIWCTPKMSKTTLVYLMK